MFTKKHYEAVAAILCRYMSNLDAPYAAEEMIQDFIELFRKDNPNFDSHRFYEACKKEQ